MSKPTITRSELLGRLRELRTVAAQHFELKARLESLPVGSLFDPPTIGVSERTRIQQQIDELKPRRLRAERRALPQGFTYSLKTIDFVIKAIDMRRATSIRQALNQYEDWRAREDAAERRHQEAMREARLNADHVASTAAMNQAMSDYLRNM